MLGRSVFVFGIGLALLAGASAANADTQVSLNLRYNDPADPNEGGHWWLVAKTDSAGIAALAFNFDPNTIAFLGHELGFTPGTDPNFGIPTVTSSDLNHTLFGGTLGMNDLTDPNEPGYYEYLYGQTSFTTGYLTGVGNDPNAAHSIGPDPLNNPDWDDASIIASGVFGSVRPQFSPVLAGEANELDSNGRPVQCADGDCLTFIVRGDSLKGTAEEDPNEGLQFGDSNRDGTVDFLDFSAMSGNYFTCSAPPNEPSWEDGNFNDDDCVDFLDFSGLSANYFNSGIPPTIYAIPEPATLSLFSMIMIGVIAARCR